MSLPVLTPDQMQRAQDRWERYLAAQPIWAQGNNDAIEPIPVASPRAQTLENEMRQVLAELELISHGKSASYNSSGAGESEAILPFGESNPPHLTFRRMFDACQSDAEVGTVLSRAKAELHALRKSSGDRTVEESSQDVSRRIRRLKYDGWTIKEIARQERCTERRVRQALAERTDTDSDEANVFALHAAGGTIRSIAMRTGLSKSHVHRILQGAERRAAA